MRGLGESSIREGEREDVVGVGGGDSPGGGAGGSRGSNKVLRDLLVILLSFFGSKVIDIKLSGLKGVSSLIGAEKSGDKKE
jgi:hypothetical protein